MSLVAYTITALERDVADATASGKQVIVGATCSMYSQPSDTVVTLYDDAAGSNGSTAKVTSENGQVVVYVEPGEYRLSVNGIDSFITIGGSAKITTVDLIALDSASNVGDVIDTTGYSVAGDGGGAQWVSVAATGAASQSPSQLGDALLNDANGNQWALVGNCVNIEALGGKADGVTDNTLVTDALIEWGKKALFPEGTYLTDSLTLLSKQIEIEGAAENLTIIKLLDNAVDNVFTLTGTAKLKLSNLTIDQNFENNTGGHGIRSGGCEKLIINNVTIQNCATYGIGFQAGTSKGVRLSNFTIKNTNSDGIDIKDYNLNNECIFITNYRAENVSIIDDDDVALDVRGEVVVNGISIKTSSPSRGIRARSGGVQGRAGFGTINNVSFEGYGEGSTIAIQLAAEEGNIVFNNVTVRDCFQAVLQNTDAVGGIINNLSANGIYGDGMSIGGSDLIVSNYTAINTTGSDRLCDVESTCVNFSLSNFFINAASSTQGVRIISGAVGTTLSNGVVRNGSIGDNGTDSIINNVRLV
jgi:hypothetical protein